MPVKIVAATPPVVVKVISSGPGWLTLLVTFLLGAALTLAVQIYVVPRVEARKRRRQRWETDVLDLGEQLSTTVTNLAREAWAAQFSVRYTASLEGNPDHDVARVRNQLAELSPAAREATQKLTDQISFQSSWRMTQIYSYRETDMVGEFFRASVLYHAHLHALDDWQKLSDADFDAWWDAEREKRRELMISVRSLATDRRALRMSWRLRLGRTKARARRVARLRRKSVEAPTPLAEQRSAN